MSQTDISPVYIDQLLARMADFHDQPLAYRWADGSVTYVAPRREICRYLDEEQVPSGVDFMTLDQLLPRTYVLSESRTRIAVDDCGRRFYNGYLLPRDHVVATRGLYPIDLYDERGRVWDQDYYVTLGTEGSLFVHFDRVTIPVSTAPWREIYPLLEEEL